MKRACAIQGATPSFIRWAISYDCPLRELHPQRLPETTFRQLRSLREISVAKLANRVHQGFCWHPSASPASPQQALGFPVDEVVELVGGEPFVEQLCLPCPANAKSCSSDFTWAGCYGGLASDLSIDFAQLLRGEYQHRTLAPTPDSVNLMMIVQDLIKRGKVSSFPHIADFDHDELNWYSLWLQSPVATPRLEWLVELFKFVLEFCLTPRSDHQSSLNLPFVSRQDQPDLSQSANLMTHDLSQMIDGMTRAIKYQLPFHVELVPPGFSDGVHWTIEPHCGRCKRSWSDNGKMCPLCQQQGCYQNEIKLKVLGIRPYLLVSHIVGEAETKRLLENSQ